MDINPEDKTSYTTQYQEGFVKYVENVYCAKHKRVPVNKVGSSLSSNPIPSAAASESSQSSFDPHDISSDDEENLMSNDVAETTPGQSNRSVHLVTAARLSLNSPPAATQN